MRKLKSKKTKNGMFVQTGYAMLEVVFYIAFFTILSIVVIQALVTMTKSFRKVAIESSLIQSGSIMERISRDLRQASDFSFSLNVLTIITKNEAGNPKSIIYTFSDSSIGMLDSELGDLGNLNGPQISVESFSVESMTTTAGKAAKVFIAVSSMSDTGGRVENFYDTIALRGSY